MDVRDDRRYTRDHEWLLPTGNGEAVIGISDYAQGELGDVVFVQLPPVGTSFAPGTVFGEIESVKIVSELFAPVGGEVIAVNDALGEHPEHVNESPYDEGWMIRIRIADPAEVDALLDAGAYAATLPRDR